ncbi:GGDEF domain-containing protein [Rhodocyclus tenuis]|uniref:GGDEF domain-containing protein n=1 Tax=Rhodocyclus tenuis TaxID=1066 RepID=UPI0019061269|nr:GGDEF domain-containing protein [Rhodocyclus tenuis]MBK1679030.1 GGDEF domain-containing protein [Rhodocyclus tenuis]
MKKEQTALLLRPPEPAISLTQVLGQSERVRDIVEECADDLSLVNAGLKRELREVDVSPGVESALEKSEVVESKVQDASEALAAVNSALKDEVRERAVIDEQLATVTRQADEARHASLHDSLTGLPNRALFNDRLEHGLASSKRNGLPLAVMFIDLDDFKMINDSYGHDVGDLVLQTIAGRLKETTREDDTVCRHGGDEFLYILMEIDSERDLATVAEKIINAVQAPCDIRVRDVDTRLSVNPSIGISIFPKDGVTADALLDLADKAMYRAKQAKTGYSFAGAA